MNIMEIMKMVNENAGQLQHIPAVMDDWRKTMALLRDYAIRADAKLDAIDAKCNLILAGPQAVTPELHENVLGFALQDPRTIEPVEYAPARNAFVEALVAQAGKTEAEAGAIYEAQYGR